MKNTIKQTLAFILALALTAGLLTGCGKGDTKDDNAGKGRYIEKDIELPFKDGEGGISFSKSKDGNPLLFGSKGSEVTGTNIKMENGKETPVKWIAELYQDQPRIWLIWRRQRMAHRYF